jgi:superfamily II DNA or RNA helicase
MSDHTRDTLTLIEHSSLTIPACDMPPSLGLKIRQGLTAENQKYRDAARYSRSTWSNPPVLEYAKVLRDVSLHVPRGAENIVRDLGADFGLECRPADRTVRLRALRVGSKITLSNAQQQAVTSVLQHRKGMLMAPPGAGKTTMAMEIIADRGQSTLWLTHTKELAQQARERTFQFLELGPGDVGLIGAGKYTVGRVLTIGMMRTFARGIAPDLLSTFGQVIVDGCHHVPAEQMARVVSQFPTYVLLGLSAMPYP